MVYAGPNSPVCQLMWDAQVSCETAAWEQLTAGHRTDFQHQYVADIPRLFYKNTDRPIIVDKCRSWTLPDNIAMIRRYMTPEPKVVVLTRPIDEIVESFIRIHEANGLTITEDELRLEGSEPIMRSCEGVKWAVEHNNDGGFMFVTYAEFMLDPANTLGRIYKFYGWEPFVHDFENIVSVFPEDDAHLGLVGLHTVRPHLARRVIG